MASLSVELSGHPDRQPARRLRRRAMAARRIPISAARRCAAAPTPPATSPTRSISSAPCTAAIPASSISPPPRTVEPAAPRLAGRGGRRRWPPSAPMLTRLAVAAGPIAEHARRRRQRDRGHRAAQRAGHPRPVRPPRLRARAPLSAFAVDWAPIRAAMRRPPVGANAGSAVETRRPHGLGDERALRSARAIASSTRPRDLLEARPACSARHATRIPPASARLWDLLEAGAGRARAPRADVRPCGTDAVLLAAAMRA